MELVMNSTNQTADLSGYDWLFITVGVVHILFVIIPVLVVGPIVLAPFVINKKLRDSVSIVFMFIIVLCMSGPLVYGLLMDLSLITDIEVLGPCTNTYNLYAFFVFFAFYHQQMLLCNALLAILQNISVRHGIKKVPVKVTVVILIFLSLYSFAGSFLIFISGTSDVRLRGSLCSQNGTGIIIVGALTVCLYAIPSILAIGIFSVLTIRFIKKNTIFNQEAVKRLIKIIVIWLILSLIIRSLVISTPFIPQAIQIYSTEISYIFSFTGFYAAELNYPLFLFLSLFLHTRVKKSVKMSFQKLLAWKKSKEQPHRSTTENTVSHDI